MNRVVITEAVRTRMETVWFWTFTAVVALVALFAAGFDRPASGWPSLVWVLALIVGSGTIGPERSSGTLQLILVKPLSRATYLVSRVVGATLVVSTTIAVALAFELTGRVIWQHGSTMGPVLAGALNSVLDTVLVCALLALFGSLARGYANVAIYLAAKIGLDVLLGVLGMLRVMEGGGSALGGIGRFIAQHPGIAGSVAWAGNNLFPDAPRVIDLPWTLLILSNAALALLGACLVFRNREVPYLAD